MKLFRAQFDTRHFDFEGYGHTEKEAIDVCYEGWLDHCRNYNPCAEIDPDYVKREDIGAYEIQTGLAYRDREPIGEGIPTTLKSVTVTTHHLDGPPTVETVELALPDIEEPKDFWCDCTESPGSDFHDDVYDDDGRRTEKHHYTCQACGKVTQIG